MTLWARVAGLERWVCSGLTMTFRRFWGVLYPACQPGLFEAINDTGERAGSETHDGCELTRGNRSGLFQHAAALVIGPVQPKHIGHGLAIDHRPGALTYDGGRISAIGGGLMLTVKEARAVVNGMPPGAPSGH